MAGLDRNTGALLGGWPHVEQSLAVLLTTGKGSRVMRRAYGAGLPRRVDAPISPATVIDFYADAANAIRSYEPRFRVARLSIESASAGRLTVLAEGVYFPRAHLGDFSVSVPKSATVAL